MSNIIKRRGNIKWREIVRVNFVKSLKNFSLKFFVDDSIDEREKERKLREIKARQRLISIPTS